MYYPLSIKETFISVHHLYVFPCNEVENNINRVDNHYQLKLSLFELKYPFMKKVGIMLLAIAAIAIAGSTLAFKAKFRGPKICYTAAFTDTQGIPTCTDPNEVDPEIRTCSLEDWASTSTAAGWNYSPVCTTLSIQGKCPTNKTGAQCGVIFTKDE
jgi:hypothetical protein